MNIKSFLPKNAVIVEEEVAKAPKYEGTFEELKELVNTGVVGPIIKNGEVIGLNVNTGLGQVADHYAGENFAKVYSPSRTMKWYEMILNGEEPAPAPAPTPTQEEDFEEVGEETMKAMAQPCMEKTEVSGVTLTYSVHELPEGLVPESGLVYIPNIKRWVRYDQQKCFAKGTSEDIVVSVANGQVKVSGIKWGRKLTETELDILADKLGIVR